MEKKSFYTHPTKKVVIIFVILWVVSTLLLVLAITDGFQESLFKKNNLIINSILFGSTFTTVSLIRNYIKNKKTD
ncbi:MAG: hypothetical protein CMB99_08335 [Flavobacteriaceae bacterium]|nr:hypothetical protein [Flavobacteriaceae bacterium]|tara:strand:+ start:86459 stop:86683 length:225 start_codon:yes stop_codon:yes gene_type:complete